MCFLDLSPSCHNVCYKTTFFCACKKSTTAIHSCRKQSTWSLLPETLHQRSTVYETYLRHCVTPRCLSLLYKDATIRWLSLDIFYEKLLHFNSCKHETWIQQSWGNNQHKGLHLSPIWECPKPVDYLYLNSGNLRTSTGKLLDCECVFQSWTVRTYYYRLCQRGPITAQAQPL